MAGTDKVISLKEAKERLAGNRITCKKEVARQHLVKIREILDSLPPAEDA